MNIMAELEKSRLREIALNSKDFKKSIEYLRLRETTLVEALEFLKEIQLPGLWNQAISALRIKSLIHIEGKSAKEKLEEAGKIRLNFFWKIILEENDVRIYLQELSKEEMLSIAERMDYMELLRMNEKMVQFMSHS